MTNGETIGLNDPRREEILAELQGRLPAVNRLQNVAQPTTINQHRFPSKKEAGRFVELKLAERAGLISHLEIQVVFPLVVNGVPIFPRGYVADFVYLDHRRDGFTKLIVEDAKGVRMEKYIIKRQLMLAIWGITILET
jgi:Protein of unknown function (DUF1064)